MQQFVIVLPFPGSEQTVAVEHAAALRVIFILETGFTNLKKSSLSRVHHPRSLGVRCGRTKYSQGVESSI